MAITPFPHRYTVELSGDELVADSRAPIRVGAPPQFGGTAEVWSPEHLLVAAVLGCLKTTFDAYAAHQQVHVHSWQASATAVLAKGVRGPDFTNIVLEVAIVSDPGDEARVEALVATAERNCIVSRALSAPVEVRAHVTGAPVRAA